MANKYAIINGIKTDHKVIAIVDVIDYEVWGNARDGFEVNNAFTRARGVEFDATCVVNGLPICPGAKDDFREFPACGSFSVDQTTISFDLSDKEITISFDLSDKEIAHTFGLTPAKIETEGDDLTIYINLASNSKPIGELRIVGYKEVDGARIYPVKV